MERDALRRLLDRLQRGQIDVRQALGALQTEPLGQLGYAQLDLHRAVRRGFPEVVYGAGKTPEQTAGIVAELCRAGQTVLVTRAAAEAWEAVRRVAPQAEWHETARAIVVRARRRRRRGRPGLVVISAGTSDLPVAEEAALTAELMGCAVERIHDVGVAGLHRLTSHRHTLSAARVIVAVAGMDGVLPTLVTGLTDCPVVGVPTSTGYGLGGRGEAALLAMLNSCAPGLTVVNIDNGFGAGCAAAMILLRSGRVFRRDTNGGNVT